MKTIIVFEVPNYPIRPGHIDTTSHFWDALGNFEKEISAHWIVRLCQERGSWAPFTREEMKEFYSLKFGKKGLPFTFNGLDDGRHIVERDGALHVTHRFVAACFESSPKVECGGDPSASEA